VAVDWEGDVSSDSASGLEGGGTVVLDPAGVDPLLSPGGSEKGKGGGGGGKDGSDGGKGGGGGGGHEGGGGGGEVGRGGWKDVEGKVKMDSSRLAPSVLATSGPSVTGSTCIAGTLAGSSEQDQNFLLADSSSGLGGRIWANGLGSKLTRASDSVAGGKIGPEFLLAPTLIHRPLAFRGGVRLRSFSNSTLILLWPSSVSSAEVDPCSTSSSFEESQAGSSILLGTSKLSELAVEGSTGAIEVSVASSATEVSVPATVH